MRKILIGLVMAVTALGVAMPALAWDNASEKVCSDTTASDEVKEAAGCNDKDANVDKTMEIIGNILNVVIGFVAIISVIVIVIAGIQMTVSQGEASKVARARNAILYAVIGLVISLLAFAIVNFVLTGVFGGGSTP